MVDTAFIDFHLTRIECGSLIIVTSSEGPTDTRGTLLIIRVWLIFRNVLCVSSHAAHIN